MYNLKNEYIFGYQKLVQVKKKKKIAAFLLNSGRLLSVAFYFSSEKCHFLAF